MKLKSLQEFMEDCEPKIHLIIKLDLKLAGQFNLKLSEGLWLPSSEKGFMQRLDKAHFSHDQLHVHIAPKKHINARSQQVSWNADGTKHDRKTFNNNIVGLERAKRAAKSALGLTDDSLLEDLNIPEEAILLLENIENLPSSAQVYIFDFTGKNYRLS